MLKKSLLVFLTFFGTLLFGAEKTTGIIVCESGYEMFEWDLRLLAEARETVEISGTFTGGKILQGLMDVIESRLEVCPNLQVHLLYSPQVMKQEDHDLLAMMRATYPHNFHCQASDNVVIFLPDVSGLDNHMKMVVVDGKYFSAGETNLDDIQCADGSFTPPDHVRKGLPGAQLPAAFRDMDIVGRGGPVVEKLRRHFFKNYAMWEDYFQTGKLQRDFNLFENNTHYVDVEAPDQTRVPSFEKSERKIEVGYDKISLHFGGPHQYPNNKIRLEYEKVVEKAQKSIVFGSFYFAPVEPLFEKIVDAANRGVSIRVQTNGIHDRSPSLNVGFVWANRLSYVPLYYGRNYGFWEGTKVLGKPKNDVKIYEYYVGDVVYHKKDMVVDNRYTIIGSYNLGVKSDRCDYELAFVIDSEEVAAEMLKVLDFDLTLCREVKPNDALIWYFDPWYSYLGNVQKKFHGFL